MENKGINQLDIKLTELNIQNIASQKNVEIDNWLQGSGWESIESFLALSNALDVPMEALLVTNGDSFVVDKSFTSKSIADLSEEEHQKLYTLMLKTGKSFDETIRMIEKNV